MNFQPISFSFKMPLKNTKTIIYKNTQIPIDFDILKRNSNYFEINSQRYIKIHEIKLLEEEGDTVDFPIKAIQDFLSCCQNQPIEINSSNIFYLNYLSKKYSVTFLETMINRIISQNKGKLAIQSLLFNINLNINQEQRMIKTEEEEKIISDNFEQYVKNEELTLIPLSILYRIVSSYFSKSYDNDHESNEGQFNNDFIHFLSLIFEKHGRKASIFLSFLKITKIQFEKTIQLYRSFTEDFDMRYLNSSLMNTAINMFNELSLFDAIKNKKLDKVEYFIPIGKKWEKGRTYKIIKFIDR